jgi:hypothetical protein
MDERQHAELTKYLDGTINVLRSTLIALWAIFGLLLFHWLR